MSPERGGDVLDPYLTENDMPDADAQLRPYRWTDQGGLETDPDGIAPVAGVSPGDYESVRDSAVWNRPGAGRKSESEPVPDPDQLAAMRRVAGQVVAMQDDEALLGAMTEAELAAAREQARQLRERERAHDRTMREFDLAEAEAEAEHARRMRNNDRQLRQAYTAARQRQQQVQDPTHRLVLLSRLER